MSLDVRSVLLLIIDRVMADTTTMASVGHPSDTGHSIVEARPGGAGIAWARPPDREGFARPWQRAIQLANEAGQRCGDRLDDDQKIRVTR